jgi:hypothetical protein
MAAYAPNSEAKWGVGNVADCPTVLLRAVQRAQDTLEVGRILWRVCGADLFVIDIRVAEEVAQAW